MGNLSASGYNSSDWNILEDTGMLRLSGIPVEERCSRFARWWEHNGIISAVVKPGYNSASGIPVEQEYLDPFSAARKRDRIVREINWTGDAVPHVPTYIGPGSLAVFLGSDPETVDGSVWFHELENTDIASQDIVFYEDNIWWKRTERLFSTLKELNADSSYYIAFPDLAENWDILASLIGASDLLMKMMDNPSWVESAIEAIGRVYEEVFVRIHRMAAAADGSMVYGPFHLFGKGTCAKVQCDGSAMFSPDMFGRFVLPELTRQCAFLDNSMYHLDGTQCIVHLDSILGIGALDAVEWTPQAGKPGGTDPVWFSMYRKILEAGKSLQVLVEDLSEVPSLLNEVGTEGVYLLGIDIDGAELEAAVHRFLKTG
jgi:hypothetical protein